MALAGLGLLVALATYDALDPSLNTATTQHARNLAGPVGAVIADVLLQAFGAAGAMPGIALIAWAWRVGARGGSGFGVAGRIAALLGAMPALGAVLSLLPGPGGLVAQWPAGAGPGGAVGRTLADGMMTAGREMLGPFGAMGVMAGVGVLAVLLVLLTLGLTAGEWRAAGNVGQAGWLGVKWAAQGAGRAGSMLAGAATWLLRRINGSKPMQPVRVVQSAPRFDTGAVEAERIEPVFGPKPAVDRSVVEEEAPPAPPTVKPPERLTGATKAATGGRGKLPKQPELPLEQPGWKHPPMALLKSAPSRAAIGAPSEEALAANARLLEQVLGDYGVQGVIKAWRAGPVVTLYELEPAPGIRAARVIGLADDVARSLSVAAVRIATVIGRNVIGIEVPNARRETVYLRDLFESEGWEAEKGKLSIALGKDISGKPVFADLTRMPHLLVAGTTGSGKSVGINAMILSLLYRLSPEQCRLIMIDPKMLELSVYADIPHLLAPVVTEPAKAVVALKWVVREMERRYRAMSQLGVRNIGGYNDRVIDARGRGEVVTRRVQTGFDPETGKPTHEEQPLALEPLPFIVVVIDEMADLMMVAGKEIEAAVQRLAQMARAAGIHVVMATQRPSVDVITGTIKANFPTRISFQVISKFDSRTILGEQGAEQLLGMGDMLHMVGGGRIQRVHGPFVGDQEVEEVVAYLRQQGEPAYVEEVTELSEDGEIGSIVDASEGEKTLFDMAVDVVTREGKASTSFIQRHLKIGYNRAASLIEQMEREGIVGPANHVGKRDVLTRRNDED